MGRLTGKIAFITGTANNQGRAAARLFAAEGAFVVGCDVKTEGANETAELVRAAGGRMLSMAPVDLADPQGARAWIEFGIAAAGGIDVLYNNAAATKWAPIESLTAADWAYTLRNELDIVFHVTQAAWEPFIARGGGSIINTASVSAVRGSRYSLAHSTGKAGVLGFTLQAALEGAPHRIRVNSISPGPIESPGVVEYNRVTGGKMREAIPLNRYGRPEDVAYCALYLASSESDFVTGANIVVDGGLTAKLY
jgi:meso-butanediol dehydrogenase/(S,S)-butanediol dehydrogenase/diacetyl reductase